MRSPWLAAIVCAALAASLIGCSVDHTRAAADLESDLSQMPGVKSVDQTYEAGDVFLPGSLTVQVVMSPDATTEETLAVIDAAYDEFTTTHDRDSANLAIRQVGAEILVHTQEERADVDDVLAIARFTLDAPRPGERMHADVVAHNRDDYGPLVSDLRLGLGRGTTEEDVIPRLDALAAAGGLPEGADFWVLAADGAGVGGSRGLPTEDDVALWRELSSVATPGTLRVEFGPYQLYSDLDDFAFANVTVRANPAPSKEQLAAMKRTHQAALAARSAKYVYNVTVNGEDAIWLQGPKI